MIKKENKKVGRPTLYEGEKTIEKAMAYLESCVDEEYDWTKSSSANGETWEHRIKVKLPTVEGLAIYLNTLVRNLYSWADEHPEFLHTLELIKQAQKERLVSKSISGDYNSTIVKLMLSANHGMREKTDLEVSNPDGNLKTIIINKYVGGNNQPSS